MLILNNIFIYNIRMKVRKVSYRKRTKRPSANKVRTFRKRYKSTRQKSKKSTRRSRVNRRRNHTRKYKGGSQPWTSYTNNPLQVTPSCDYYPLSRYGIPVGGPSPYPYSGGYKGDYRNIKKFGKRSKGSKRNRRQRGGLGISDFLPQPLLNTWRTTTGHLWDGAYKYAGVKPPASFNSDPTNQPIDKNYKFIGGIPPDVPSINQFAGEAVSNMKV
jgi:hypothetical protein